jgi:hypothetical protein
MAWKSQAARAGGSLAKLVSEEANPRNALGLARVEVLLPVAVVDHGVVLR